MYFKIIRDQIANIRKWVKDSFGMGSTLDLAVFWVAGLESGLVQMVSNVFLLFYIDNRLAMK